MSTQNRGFAGMDREKQRQIASKGGRSAHAKGTAHVWDSETAKVAGRKGGIASRGGRGRLADVPVMPTQPAETPSTEAAQ